MYTNNITSDQHTFKLHTSPWPAEIVNIFYKISRNTNSLKSEEILLVLNQQICRNPRKILLVLIVLLVLFIHHGRQKKPADSIRSWPAVKRVLTAGEERCRRFFAGRFRPSHSRRIRPACMHAKMWDSLSLSHAMGWRKRTEKKNGRTSPPVKSLATGEELQS